MRKPIDPDIASREPFGAATKAFEETKPNVISDFDPRIYMSAERTFLAWIRTGIALMGFGFVVARFGLFLRELATENPQAHLGKPSFSLFIGIILLGMGMLIMVGSMVRHRRYIQSIDRGDFRKAFNSNFAILIATMLATVGLAMTIYLAILW